MHKQLKQLDLNLLRLLAMLVKTGNTQQAAKRLGISQASASRGLSKLREAFGAELFARKSHGLAPSPLAIEMAEKIASMLDPLDDVLRRHQQFDPRTYRGELRIVADRTTLSLLGRQLTRHLTSALPQADLSLVGWGGDGLRKLLAGEYNYGIQSSWAQIPKSLHTSTLSEQALGILARKHHPALAGEIDWAAICRYPLVRLFLPLTNTLDTSPSEQVLERQGLDYRMQLKTDDIQILLGTLLDSEAIWLGGPQMIAGLYPGLEFHPFPDAEPIALYAAYLATRRNLPLYDFLDSQIRDLITDITRY